MLSDEPSASGSGCMGLGCGVCVCGMLVLRHGISKHRAARPPIAGSTGATVRAIMFE